jgi:hypothetical protein
MGGIVERVFRRPRFKRLLTRLRALNSALLALLNCAVDLADRGDALSSAIFLASETADELERLDEVLGGSVAAEPAND